MKFNDYKYVRPNYGEVKEKFDIALKKVENSQSFEELVNNINDINKIRNNYSTMKHLSGIRFSMNTKDEFYIQENDYFDKYWPYYKELNVNFYKVLLNSKFLPELKQKYGEQFFKVAQNSLRAFDPSIMDELQEENRLISEVSKIKSSAQILFDGEYKNLAQLAKYLESDDREMRKSASKAYFGFFEENQNIIDDIYDKLVKLRDKKAKKLEFNNYIELAYVEMDRTDYDSNMVEKFRNQVLEYIVPVASELIERQKRRINIEDMQYYDENLKFLTGNATPKGTPEEILNKETGEYFDFMMDQNLIDVLTRDGKEGGGFCSFIPDYKAPFIFSNFNGTSADINVLTHEAGHAFQHYMSRNIEMPESNSATMESAEIHSMSMEFFTWPFMERFFKEDTEKYKFYHVEHALEFIAYGVVVDEFQHKVYANPNATPMERRQMWRETEKKYLPHRKYDENPFLESGTWWYKQGHIFFRPFYYIDYTLAQVCAFQFWKRMNNNSKEAWQDYLNLCKLGGTKSFLGLLESAKLKSPFDDGSIEDIVIYAKQYLDSIDDSIL